MNPNEAPTENEEEKQARQDWLSQARQSLQLETVQKSLQYGYDFLLDRPLPRSSRYQWQSGSSSPLSPKRSIPRSSSAFEFRSTMSTNPTLDFELTENLPSIPPNPVELSHPNTPPPGPTIYIFRRSTWTSPEDSPPHSIPQRGRSSDI